VCVCVCVCGYMCGKGNAAVCDASASTGTRCNKEMFLFEGITCASQSVFLGRVIQQRYQTIVWKTGF